MNWKDQGLVLGVRRHGETSAILELMTHHHGRYLGLVRGGRSRKMRPILQPGNLLNIEWRARLDEHLGYYQVEPELLRAASIMEHRASLFCVQVLATHLRLLPERESFAHMYTAANIILDHADVPKISTHLLIRFELALLEALGFGLSLNKCVVSGTTKELVWVSPKSGCAVCRSEGEPWAGKLLPLPKLMLNQKQDSDEPVTVEDLKAGLRLTGHFLERNVYIPRAQSAPDERAKLIGELSKPDAPRAD
jgi:DNA repair protein RecO (recombination protein O)